MDLRQVFAANLRRFRHDKGLTQEALADLAVVDRTYLSKLETGATWVGLEIIGKLAKVLKRPPSNFLEMPKNAGKSR